MVDINLSLGVGLGANARSADPPPGFGDAMNQADPITRPGQGGPAARDGQDVIINRPPSAPHPDTPGNTGNGTQPPGHTAAPGTQGGAQGGLHGPPPGGPQGGAGLNTPPGAQQPADPQAATALSGGDKQALLTGAQGPAAVAMPRDGAPPAAPAELSVSIGGDGTVTVEVNSGSGRSTASPMAPVRFATSDPIAALAHRSAPPAPQSGMFQLPAALAVTQQSGTAMRLNLPDNSPLRLSPGPANLRQDGAPLFSLNDFSAGRGSISETALAASRDPWAVLTTAFAGAGLGMALKAAETLPNQAMPPQGMLASTALTAGTVQNASMTSGLTLAAGTSTPALPQNIGQAATQGAAQGQVNPNGAANTNSTAFITGGQDALARLLVLGYCPKSALPLLHQTIATAPRIDDPAPALWRNQPTPDSATRALLDELESEIPLAVALGYQPMGEALRRRLQTEGPALLQRILERVARFEGLFGQSPLLPAGKILRRGIADDGPMLRQARSLTLGTVFQELALVAASVFPELGDSAAGFLSRKLSSEIILARGVRGLAIDDGVVALAPETRFVLAGRMRKADDGIHLILLAFGTEDRRPILRGAAC